MRSQRYVVQALAAFKPRQRLTEHMPLEVLALGMSLQCPFVDVLLEQEEAPGIVCRTVRRTCAAGAIEPVVSNENMMSMDGEGSVGVVMVTPLVCT